METKRQTAATGGRGRSRSWGGVARFTVGAAALAASLGCVLRVLGPMVQAVAPLAHLPTAESVRFLTAVLVGG